MSTWPTAVPLASALADGWTMITTPARATLIPTAPTLERRSPSTHHAKTGARTGLSPYMMDAIAGVVVPWPMNRRALFSAMRNTPAIPIARRSLRVRGIHFDRGWVATT